MMKRQIERVAGLVYRRSSAAYGFVHRLRVAAAGLRPQKECRECVQHSGIPGVTVAENGVCADCRRHDDRFDRTKVQRSAARFFELPGGGAPNVLMMLSGGKDSLAALALAARRERTRPIALMLDHGFIPEAVRNQSADFCSRLGVELVVRRFDIRNDVAAAWRRPGMNPFVCFPCCEAQAREALRFCTERGIRKIVTGLRWNWKDRFLPVTTAASAYRYFRVPAREDIEVLNIVAAEAMTEREELDLLAEQGLKFRQIGGDSTCCELFGVFENEYRRRFGHFWEGERFLSKEIRAGTLTKAEARQKLALPPHSPETAREILRRAGVE